MTGSVPQPAQVQPYPQEEGAPKKTMGPVPLLLDVSFTTAKILIILAGAIIGIVSVLSGATWLATAIRSGAAVLSMGLLLYLANFLLSRNALEAARMRLLAEMQSASANAEAAARAAAESAGQSTIEKQA